MKVTNTRTSLRPPIFNPYDRFTQPEFDAWIGDLTHALKRALEPEAEPGVDSPSRHNGSWNTVPDQLGGSFSAEGQAQSPAPSEGYGEQSILEDSFAQIASRRAKGKARDPREGPGLGLKGQPIELLSDSEEEEVIDSLEAGATASDDSDNVVEEGSSGELDYAKSDVDEGRGVSQPGTSTQHIVTFLSSDDPVQGQEVAGHFNTQARHNEEGVLRYPENAETFLEDEDDGDDGVTDLGDREGTDDGASSTFITSRCL